MSEGSLPIGVLAERYDVPATTLRCWEDIGILSPPLRSSGQHRCDLDAPFQRIKFIHCAVPHARRSLDGSSDYHRLAPCDQVPLRATVARHRRYCAETVWWDPPRGRRRPVQASQLRRGSRRPPSATAVGVGCWLVALDTLRRWS